MRRRLTLVLLGVAVIVVIAHLIRSARAPAPAPVPPEEIVQTEPDDPLDAPPAPPPPHDLSKLTVDELIDRLDNPADYASWIGAFREIAHRGPAGSAARAALRSIRNDRGDIAYWAALAECAIEPDRHDAHLARALAVQGFKHDPARIGAVIAAPGLVSEAPARRDAAFKLLETIGCRPGDPSYPALVKILRDPKHPDRARARELLWSAFVRTPTEVGRTAPVPSEEEVRLWSRLTPEQVADWVPLLTDPDQKLAAIAGAVLVLSGEFAKGLPVVVAHEWPVSGLLEIQLDEPGARMQPDYLPLAMRERLNKARDSAAEKEQVRAVAAPALRDGKTLRAKRTALQAMQTAGATDPDALAPAFADPDTNVRRAVARDLLSWRWPQSAVPQIAEYLRREPDPILETWFDEWFPIVDELPQAALDFIAARVLPTNGKPGFSTAFGRLPTTGPGADRTLDLVVRYLAAPADPKGGAPAFESAVALAGRLGPAATAAVPSMRRGLKSTRREEIVRTADAILKVVPGDPEAIAALVAVIDARGEGTYLAVDLLGKQGAAAAPHVPKLMALVEAGLRTKDGAAPFHGEIAAEALGALGEHARPALPLLRSCLETPLTEQSPVGVIVRAAGAGGRIDPTDRAVVPWLTDVLTERRKSPRNHHLDARLYAAESLVALGPAARAAVPELIEFARRDGGRCRGLAPFLVQHARDKTAEILNLFADGFILGLSDWNAADPALQQVAADSTAHRSVAVRRAAWSVLAAVGVADKDEAGLRARAAGESDPVSARAAAVAFARRFFHREPEQVKAIEAWHRANNRRLLPRRLARVNETGSWSDPMALRPLGETAIAVAETDPRVLRAHVALLIEASDKGAGAGHGRETPAIVQALARAAPDSIAPLSARLGADRSPEIRVRAALALMKIGPKAVAAVPALTKALNDRYPAIRWAMAEALLAIDPPGSPDAVRALAQYAFAPLTQEEQFLQSDPRALVLEVTNNREPLTTLRGLSSAALAPAADLFAKYYADPNSLRRAEVGELLLRADPPRAVEVMKALVGALTAPRDPVRNPIHHVPEYAVMGRLDASARPASKVLADALAAHADDELTPILARALRRVDPAAARAAGVR